MEKQKECKACGAPHIGPEEFCKECTDYKRQRDQNQMMRAIMDREARRRAYFGELDAQVIR